MSSDMSLAIHSDKLDGLQIHVSLIRSAETSSTFLDVFGVRVFNDLKLLYTTTIHVPVSERELGQIKTPSRDMVLGELAENLYILCQPDCIDYVDGNKQSLVESLEHAAILLYEFGIAPSEIIANYFRSNR